MRGMNTKTSAKATQANMRAKAAAMMEPGLSSLSGPPTGTPVKPMRPTPGPQSSVKHATMANQRPVAYAKGGAVKKADGGKVDPQRSKVRAAASDDSDQDLSDAGFFDGNMSPSKMRMEQQMDADAADNAEGRYLRMRGDGYKKGGAAKKGKAKHADAAQDKALFKQMMAQSAAAAPADPGAMNGMQAMKKGGKAGGNWIKGAVKKPGALHADLGVPQGEKIPKAKIAAAAKKSGKIGQRARFAENVAKFADGGAVGKNAMGPVAPYKNASSPNPMSSDGMTKQMKSGGRAFFAQGGVAKMRRGVADKSGAPIAGAVPRGKLGRY